MKKIFTLISIFSVSITGLWAQATPNPGFEAWTTQGFPSYEQPDNWNTANAQTNILGTFTCIKASGVDKHSGTYAIKLITKQIGAPFNVLVPGFATTGTLPASITGALTGGIPYTLRPDSITGWYKYTPQGGENGYIQFLLFGSAANNADTIARGGFATPTTTVGAYTWFSAPLVYTASTNPVANSMWLLSSSNNDGLVASIGSTLFVDDLALVINPSTAVAEQEQFELTIGPNPAVDHFVIKNELNSKALFMLYDVTGRKVAEENIGKATHVVNVNTLPDGLYFYSVSDESNTVIKSGKLIIQK
ncbi:MAG: T9SS type A sorting domain-containing protein [Bacteroidetes bacterium]|nr:T9SS type A sorting domain-containing protein [Bacteroidota bacterium]